MHILALLSNVARRVQAAFPVIDAPGGFPQCNGVVAKFPAILRG
jgi:hypothetical protein